MAETQDLGACGKESESDMPHSYEAALWAAHRKALETTEALQSNLNSVPEHNQLASMQTLDS